MGYFLRYFLARAAYDALRTGSRRTRRPKQRQRRRQRTLQETLEQASWDDIDFAFHQMGTSLAAQCQMAGLDEATVRRSAPSDWKEGGSIPAPLTWRDVDRAMQREGVDFDTACRRMGVDPKAAWVEKWRELLKR